jgi:hypothetical protein
MNSFLNTLIKDDALKKKDLCYNRGLNVLLFDRLFVSKINLESDTHEYSGVDIFYVRIVFF